MLDREQVRVGSGRVHDLDRSRTEGAEGVKGSEDPVLVGREGKIPQELNLTVLFGLG